MPQNTPQKEVMGLLQDGQEGGNFPGCHLQPIPQRQTGIHISLSSEEGCRSWPTQSPKEQLFVQQAEHGFCLTEDFSCDQLLKYSSLQCVL